MTDGAVPEIVVDGVTKRYGRTLALDDVALAVRPNELFALLGPNGAGKTTLLHILCTILKPDSGTARIGGIDVVAQPLQARRSLGVVFQEPSLDDRLTVGRRSRRSYYPATKMKPSLHLNDGSACANWAPCSAMIA